VPPKVASQVVKLVDWLRVSHVTQSPIRVQVGGLVYQNFITCDANFADANLP